MSTLSPACSRAVWVSMILAVVPATIRTLAISNDKASGIGMTVGA